VRNITDEPRVAGTEDDTYAAFAELPRDFVRPDARALGNRHDAADYNGKAARDRRLYNRARESL